MKESGVVIRIRRQVVGVGVGRGLGGQDALGVGSRRGRFDGGGAFA